MKIAFASVILLCLFAGCGERLILPKDPIRAERVMQQFIPVGTPKEEVIHKLKAQNAFVKEASGNFGGREIADYLYVDYREAGTVGYSRWQFAIELRNGRVFAHYCTFGTVSL